MGETGEAQVAGRVAELWRYPVKSMLGELVDSIVLTADGVQGDRAFGLIDVASGHLLSAKAAPELFEARARIEGDGVVIDLPDGGRVSSDDPDHAARLSSWLGRGVELRRSPAATPGSADGAGADAGPDVEFELRLDPADEEGDLFPWPARPGSFLDSAPVHALSTASLAAMAGARAETVWDVRRFRPNLLVDTGGASGFVEDGWVGHDVAFGGDGVTIRAERRCSRCAMPLRAQTSLGDRPALDRDVAVFRTLSVEHGNDLGIYGDVSVGGVVALGDEVRVSS